MGRAPKYQQITEWIQNQIASGELSGGDRLESEHELSARFRLSRQTVRHALSELEEAGIVSRVKGSGTYIQYGTGSTEPLSQTVTIISTYADSYIFPRLLQVMVRRLSKAGYSTKIMFTNNRVETEGRLLRQLLSEGQQGSASDRAGHERAAESEFRLLSEAAGSGDPDSLFPQLLSGTVDSACEHG